MNPILTAVLPPLLDIAGIAVAGVLIRVSLVAKQRWGIEIEARHREALHAALMSGVRAALAGGLSGQAAVDAAIRHAARSVPDAINRLSPTAQVLASIAEAKLAEAKRGETKRGETAG